MRDKIIRRRRQIPPAGRQYADAAILERLRSTEWFGGCRVFFVYVSIEPEVSTRALIDSLDTADNTVLVPKITQRETMSAVRFPGWDALRPGPLGIPAPSPAPAHPGPIDVAVVPGIAFTPAGCRLGYGGGYYDRWLALHAPARIIGLAFETQLLARVPVACHDVPVHFIVTEQRLIDARRGTAGEPGQLLER